MEVAIVVTIMDMHRIRPKVIIVIDKGVEGIGAHNRINDHLNCISNSIT